MYTCRSIVSKYNHVSECGEQVGVKKKDPMNDISAFFRYIQTDFSIMHRAGRKYQCFESLILNKPALVCTLR